MTIDGRPMEQEGLRFGPLGENWIHLCIDMQRMFAEETDWHTPWMERVLPNVVSLVELDPARLSSPASSRRSRLTTWLGPGGVIIADGSE